MGHNNICWRGKLLLGQHSPCAVLPKGEMSFQTIVFYYILFCQIGQMNHYFKGGTVTFRISTFSVFNPKVHISSLQGCT